MRSCTPAPYSGALHAGISVYTEAWADRSLGPGRATCCSRSTTRGLPGCEPAALASLFADAGLTDIESRASTVPTVFAGFDDVGEPFLGAQGPAPAYVASLPENARSALRERMRASLPAAADGTIALQARASPSAAGHRKGPAEAGPFP